MAKRRSDHEESSLFERAMEGVEPLSGRAAEPPRHRQRSPDRRSRAEGPPSHPFRLEGHGEHLEGLARDADRRVLRRLRRGEVPVDLRVDLHGLDQEQARGAVREALARALGAGLRCLLVVHGRGLRSAAGPVLKEALPGWLAQAPHGHRVLAFTTAPPARGGAGATLVLLRPPRRR